MTPQETSQLLVQFVAPASPWWLLLLVPVSISLGWWLYRHDLPSLQRPTRIALVFTRCLLLVALVVLAFRPNLIWRVTLTYPGRVLFAIDDSRSMLARDDRMSDTDALRNARALSTDNDPDAPLKTAADQLSTAIARLREFERYSRQTGRSGDAFWDQAGKAQQDFDQLVTHAAETMAAAKSLIEKNTPVSLGEFAATTALMNEFRGDASAFFVGDRYPGRNAFDVYYHRADIIAMRLLELQSVLDRQRFAQGDKTLLEKADSYRARSRLELAASQITTLLPSLHRMLPNQGFEAVSVTTGKHQALDKSALQSLVAIGDQTDLAECLSFLADEPSEFPLSAIVLVTDGRDIAGRPLVPAESALARQQIPVLCAGAGEPIEPTDLAVVDIVAPPIAIAGRPITITVIIKASLTRSTRTQVELTCDGKPVIAVPVDLAPSQRVAVPITFAPEQTGLFRYELKIASPSGVTEVFPTENNSGEFVLNVRKEPVRVLLFDWTPRWETRTAFSTLQRLPYVELNAIIGTTQKEQAVTRGAERGSWPDSAATLDLYDVVILGELPEGTLTDAEWTMLQTWVEKHSGTLTFLAPRGSMGRFMIPDANRSLLPVTSAAPTTRPADLQRFDQLRFTTSGQCHPLTLAMADAFPLLADESKISTISTSLRPTGQPLMFGPAAETPLITWQPLGVGKCLLIDSDRLWLAVNPTAQRAHVQFFVELITWSIEGRWTQGSDSTTPMLALDQQRASANRGMQIWGQNLPVGAVIEACVDENVIAESPSQATRPGAALTRAHFSLLPPRGVTFRLKSDPRIATPPVLLTARTPELDYFARNDVWLSQLATATGGESRPISQIERLLQTIEPKQRVEHQEHVWRAWDSPWVMALLILILTVEWVWRKFVGLV